MAEASDDLKVNIEYPSESIAVVRAKGYIDTVTVPEMEKSIHGIIGKKIYKIIVDLASINYVSSAGWGVFVSELKDLRSNDGDIVLIGMSPEVYDVYELMEFSQILKSFSSINESLEHYGLATDEEKTFVDPSKGMQKNQQPETYKSEDSAASSQAENTTSDDLSSLPVEDKVKHLVKLNPLMSGSDMRAELKTEKYGFEKVGFFQFGKILKELNLDNEKKRKDFALSNK